MLMDVHSRPHRILVTQMAQARLLLRQQMQAAEQAMERSQLEQSPAARHLTHTHLMEAGTRQLLFTITWVQAHTRSVSKMPTDVPSRQHRILVIQMVQLQLVLRQPMQAAEPATEPSRSERSPAVHHHTHIHLTEADTRQLLFT